MTELIYGCFFAGLAVTVTTRFVASAFGLGR
jgi:hypothetical protein